MSAHTPGPWLADMSCPWIYGPIDARSKHASGRACIGQVASAKADSLDDEARANALLIAAAPELLAALKDLAGWANLAESDERYGWLAVKVNAAIAKAEGRS